MTTATKKQKQQVSVSQEDAEELGGIEIYTVSALKDAVEEVSGQDMSWFKEHSVDPQTDPRDEPGAEPETVESLVADLQQQVVIPQEEAAPSSEVTVAARVERASAVAGVDASRVRRLTLEIGVLKDGGIFGQVNTEGGSALMMAVDLASLGAWKPTQKENGTELTVRNPQVSVLPKKWVERLRYPFSQARAAHYANSYAVPVARAMVGVERFTMWTQWASFRTAYQAALDNLERVKDDLLSGDNYEKAVAAVLVQAAEMAEHSARGLEANEIKVGEDFVEKFVARVRGRIPSRDDIRYGLHITFTPAVLQTTADIAQEEAFLAEERSRIQKNEIAKDTQEAIKLEMREFVLTSLKAQLATAASPIISMIDAFKAEALEALISVRSALTAQTYLDAGDLRKLQTMFDSLQKIRTFLGTDAYDAGLSDQVNSALAWGAASNKTQSPLIGAQLETVLGNLQVELQRATPEPEDTGIGLVD